MLNPSEFHRGIISRGIGFFTGVPDSLLKSICGYIADTESPDRHIIAANEGAALALAIGHHLATGGVPLVYMQNSGLGNIVNPLTSLADKEVYSIPMLLLIGWRGEPGVKDEPQHVKQGRITPALLDALEIPFRILPDDPLAVEGCLDDMLGLISESNAPAALLVRAETFESYKYKSSPDTYPASREEAIREVLGMLAPDDVVVGTTGMPSREIYEARSAAGGGHNRDFLTVGGMGHASQIALGIAMARKDRRVICLDGDGAALMHMGSLALIGTAGRSIPFKHVLLNNGAHDSVGGQPTAGFDVDVPAIAMACGYQLALRADSLAGIKSAFPEFLRADGAALLEIRIRKGNRKDLGRPKTTPAQNKAGFIGFLCAPAGLGWQAPRPVLDSGSP